MDGKEMVAQVGGWWWWRPKGQRCSSDMCTCAAAGGAGQPASQPFGTLPRLALLPRLYAPAPLACPLPSPVHCPAAPWQPLAPPLPQVHEYFADFVALEAHHFLVPLPRTYLAMQPFAWDFGNISDAIARMTEGVAALMLSLRRRFLIRCAAAAARACRCSLARTAS